MANGKLAKWICTSLLAFAILILQVSCIAHPPSLTLALLGDLMLGRGANPSTGSLAWLAPQLHSADLSLANLESPLASVPPAAGADSGYNLCASSVQASLFRLWGLDLLSLANNHRLDCSLQGPSETARLLAAAGITPIGPGPEPLYRQVHGLKLAFLAFDDVLSPLDVSITVHAIRSARARGALVVAYIHWGAEYQSGPSDRQKALAQQFAQAGAALIVGSHPHVLQPAAWLFSAQGKTLVLYSLGNALFDQPGLPDTRQSALVLVKLDAQGVQSVKVVPFVIDVPLSRVAAPDAAAAQQIHEILQIP